MIALTVLFIKTTIDLSPVPATLQPTHGHSDKVQLLDRAFNPLTFTYSNNFNIHDNVALHNIPLLLIKAFITAEDKRFYNHNGTDTLAKLHAMLQNIQSLAVVRGASTITEQTVRMIHPRPRTFYSRWLEGFEAKRFENNFTKADILEFYLNQVPFSSRRRGVVQAARYYFDRDMETLNIKEMLTLAVLVRAPERLNIKKYTTKTNEKVEHLAGVMHSNGEISDEELDLFNRQSLSNGEFSINLEAPHFISYILNSPVPSDAIENGKIQTTLNSSLQSYTQKILNNRLTKLNKKNVKHGAVLVVNNITGEILTWVVGGEYSTVEHGSMINAVLTPRQPGSTLKPFLYAMALDKGWTAATLINDSPLSLAVGQGLHSYDNFSRSNYGEIRLREALGNSLNIPAVRTVQYTGQEEFYKKLRKLGFDSLTRHPFFYGEGIALGNGEVSLYELVRAYTTLGRGGSMIELTPFIKRQRNLTSNGIFTKESSSIIGDILSDPEARRLEFGTGNLLRFPIRTAVKTGTSTDYNDAWAVGFNSKYTVGVWMGNLDRSAMNDVTGSIGPALVLRSVFSELNRTQSTGVPMLSTELKQVKVCARSGLLPTKNCTLMDEYFIKGTAPEQHCANHEEQDYGNNSIAFYRNAVSLKPLKITQPTPGLVMAKDPRIPDNLEAFTFKLSSVTETNKVQWYVNDLLTAETKEEELSWPLKKGKHVVYAKVWRDGAERPVRTEPIGFTVK